MRRDNTVSQYTFKSTDGRFEFLAGYDRPLDYLFLVVEDLNVADGLGGQLAWSNLDPRDLPTGPGMTMEQIDATVHSFGGLVPDDVREKMLADQRAGAGTPRMLRWMLDN